MKKILILLFAFTVMIACKNEKATETVNINSASDSLKKIIEQRDNEIDDMMGTLNEIQEGFRLINEAEDRVTVATAGEGTDKAQQIKENILFIQSKMKQNRELISKLQTQLRESTFKGDQMKKSIERMLLQLEEKDKEMMALRTQLQEKDIKITELDKQVSTLNENVSELTTQNTEKAQTINTQDKQLNTAWYVFGTKDELKQQSILVKGEVLQANFNKNYFTKIDIRIDKEIKLYSKTAKILTTHPANSYNLTPDASGQYILRIINPQVFWSTSKYLVIQVR